MFFFLWRESTLLKIISSRLCNVIIFFLYIFSTYSFIPQKQSGLNLSNCLNSCTSLVLQTEDCPLDSKLISTCWVACACLRCVIEPKNLGAKFPDSKWMLNPISVWEYFPPIDNLGRWLSRSCRALSLNTFFPPNRLLKLAKILRKKNKPHKSTQSHPRVTLIKKQFL